MYTVYVTTQSRPMLNENISYFMIIIEYDKLSVILKTDMWRNFAKFYQTRFLV